MGKLTDQEKLEIILSPEFQSKFWEKFDMSGGEDACWIWKGNPRKNEKKYVSTYIKGDADRMQAHRVSLTMTLGYFPSGDTLHDEIICRDNKYRCVNPRHLRDGSPKENRIDENTAEKTIRHKNGRKKLFNEIIGKSSKAEKKYFYNILYNELFTES